MKTVSVEITIEQAKHILEDYYEAVQALADEREAISEKIDDLKALIAKMEISINGGAKQNELFKPLDRRSESGRAGRGESEKAIMGVLQSRNGTGASMKEICEITGAKYATAYRILHKLEEGGLASEVDSRWRWKDLSAVNSKEEGEVT